MRGFSTLAMLEIAHTQFMVLLSRFLIITAQLVALSDLWIKMWDNDTVLEMV